jgi:hypothetical protein
MAQPQWLTAPGSLGTIAQGKFFTLPIEAIDPDSGTVGYELISGHLPAGIQVKAHGALEGTPMHQETVQGVPSLVNQDVTSKFTVRAYTDNGGTKRINDRTFSLTVAGGNIPKFETPAGSIGLFYDGSPVNYQIQTSDSSPNNIVTVSLADGQLPPGITIDSTGLLSGYIIPQTPLPTTATAGFDTDSVAYDQFSYDFATRSSSKNYQFTLQATDGKDIVQRTYTMYVITRDALFADGTEVTVDSQVVTADESQFRIPLIYNHPSTGLIGTFRHSNFFVYQLQGTDLDGDAFEFRLYPGDTLPDGLSLDLYTGWIYGYLPDQGATVKTHDFRIQIFKQNDNSLMSNPYTYQITIVGDIEANVTWISPTNLGTISNGDISLLKVEATNASGRVLNYRLKQGTYPAFPGIDPGVYNSLPQGLALTTSGEISGRASFNTFSVDGGTTTFDQNLSTRLDGMATTFDHTYKFTVEVYSADGQISVFKDFTITVARDFDAPYETLYIEAMPTITDRVLLDSLLQNQDIIKPEYIFRKQDQYFGLSHRIQYVHAYGLHSSTVDQYVDSLKHNHFRKKLTLGDFKIAQALDADGNVVYEVVYSDIIDDGVNGNGQSPAQKVNTAFPILDGVTTVEPNSLINMRDQVVDSVGQYAQVLPLWMKSKQKDGTVLGYTRAWVIAYCVPGKAEELVYNIKTEWSGNLNLINFDIDRYTIDRQYSHNWGATVTGTITATSHSRIDFNAVVKNGSSTMVFLGDSRINLPIGAIVTSPTDNGISPNTRIVNRVVSATSQVSYILSQPYTGNDGIIDADAIFNSITLDSNRGINALDKFIVANNVNNAGGLINNSDAPAFQVYYVIEPTAGSSLDATQVTLAASWNDARAGIPITVTNSTALLGTFVAGNSWRKADFTTFNHDQTTNPTSTHAETTFDANSMKFTSPLDTYGLTDQYNRYILFPKQNITDIGYNEIVPWVNQNDQLITWVNNAGDPVNWIKTII